MSGFAGIKGWRIRINADYREEKIHTSKESKYQFHNGNKSEESEMAKANQKHLLSIPNFSYSHYNMFSRFLTVCFLEFEYF